MKNTWLLLLLLLLTSCGGYRADTITTSVVGHVPTRGSDAFVDPTLAALSGKDFSVSEVRWSWEKVGSEISIGRLLPNCANVNNGTPVPHLGSCWEIAGNVLVLRQMQGVSYQVIYTL